MRALVDQEEESFYVEFDSTIGWTVYGSETGVFCNAFRDKYAAEEYCNECISMLNALYFSNQMSDLINNPFPELINRVTRYARCGISDVKDWSNINNIDKFPDFLIQKDILEMISEY